MNQIRKHADHLRTRGLDSFEGVQAYDAPFVTSHGEKREVIRVECVGVTLYIKRIHLERFKDRLNGLIFNGGAWSSARREWKNYLTLDGKPIAGAEAVAIGEQGGPFTGESYIITEAAPGIPLDEFLDAEPCFRRRRMVLRDLADKLRQMHDLGIAFPDLFARHVFVDLAGPEPRFRMIDVARLDGPGAVYRRTRARDLAALHVSLPLRRRLTLAGRLRFLRAYEPDPHVARDLVARVRRRSLHLLKRAKFAAFDPRRPTRVNPPPRRSAFLPLRRPAFALAAIVVGLGMSAYLLWPDDPLTRLASPRYAVNLIDFGNDGTPDGFMLVGREGSPPQEWKSVPEPSNGHAVLSAIGLADASQPRAGDAAETQFPLLLYGRLDTRDVLVSVKFRIDSGSNGRAAGLVVRHQDNDRYYVARASAEDHTLSLVRMEPHAETSLAEVNNVPVSPDTWHTLTLDTHGSRFRVWLNGQRLIDARDFDNDGLIDQPGKVGLWAKGDAAIFFDAMAIRPVDPQNPMR